MYLLIHLAEFLSGLPAHLRTIAFGSAQSASSARISASANPSSGITASDPSVNLYYTTGSRGARRAGADSTRPYDLSVKERAVEDLAPKRLEVLNVRSPRYMEINGVATRMSFAQPRA